LWGLASQPIMHVLFNHDVHLIDATYNCQAMKNRLYIKSGSSSGGGSGDATVVLALSNTRNTCK
jgi:hypothetical protein